MNPLRIYEEDPGHPALWARVLGDGALRVISDNDRQWLLQKRVSDRHRIKWRSIAFCGTRVGLARAILAAGVLEGLGAWPEHFREGANGAGS